MRKMLLPITAALALTLWATAAGAEIKPLVGMTIRVLGAQSIPLGTMHPGQLYSGAANVSFQTLSGITPIAGSITVSLSGTTGTLFDPTKFTYAISLPSGQVNTASNGLGSFSVGVSLTPGFGPAPGATTGAVLVTLAPAS